MAELNELLNKALQSAGLDEETIKTVNSNFKNNIEVSKAKFKDISTGEYKNADAYNKLAKELEDCKANHQTDLDTKLKEAADNNKKLMSEQVSKFKGIIKNMNFDNFINKLGEKNEYTIAGIKAKLESNEDITVDDEFNLVGYEDAFKSISDSYKVQETTRVVGTKDSNIVKNASTGGNKVYHSLDEIRHLSKAEVQADFENIKNQLPNLM